MVIDNTGKWTVIRGHVAKVNKQLVKSEGNVKVTKTSPVNAWGKPSNVPNTGTLHGNDNNIFCSEREAWEEADYRNNKEW